jgi:DNA invertase Pin-like site-specific DNA recombinase
MKITKEDLLRMFFNERKSYAEIARIYGISEYRLKKQINNMGMSLERLKKRKPSGGNNGSPPEGAGGMSFELTKD